MTASLCPRLLPILVLAGLALCPVALADTGQVTAERASYRGGTDQAGGVVAFFLADNADLQSGGDALLSIDIRADRIEALQVETRYLVGPQVGEFAQPVDDPRHDRTAPPVRNVLEKARATLVAQQENFQVHVVPADPAGSIDFVGRTEAGQFVQYSGLFMDLGHFEQPGPASVDERVPDAPEFWSILLDEPLVVHDDQASHFQAHLRGDLVLEVVGGTFEAQDRDERIGLESGEWLTPAADSGGAVPAGVDEQRRVILRMFLQDADVNIGYQGATTDAFWAGRSLSSDHDGDVALDGAFGEVASDDGIQLLRNERYVLPAGSLLALAPAPQALALDVRPATTAGNVAGGSDGGQGTTALAGLVAVLALATAVALGFVRRSSAAPDLRQVEVALEKQAYGRAARIAKRILRARPGLEDAVLGRAIALSKAGRAGAAISEIHDHLAARGASDGSLHYVLGLSFLDVGRSHDASVALSEAVRRTPALQADVASRLGHAAHPDPQPTTLREVHGYA